MAAHGPWTQAEIGSSEGGAVLTRQAARQLRDVLTGLGHRLGSTPLRDATSLTALVEALRALSAQVERLEFEGVGRSQQLSDTLGLLARRLSDDAARDVHLETRLDRISDQLERLSPAHEPWPIRVILGAACTAAALSLLSAAMQTAGSQPRPVRVELTPRPLPSDLVLRPAIHVGVNVEGIEPSRPNGNPVPPSALTMRGDNYEAVVSALARGETTALPRLNGLADAGDSQAQLNLASLYETGGGGLSRDMSAARLWTLRAAKAGERIAMHNLALFLMRGEGGPQNFGDAAVWFRRASDRGVVDAQFNLAQLYETGRGVDRNLREAYRWYSVAANAGDGASREKAIELEGRVSPGERTALDREAAAFQPGAATEFDPAVIVPPAQTVAETQALLARQGYFVGPVDGVISAAFRTAVAAYLRDHPGASAEVAPMR